MSQHDEISADGINGIRIAGLTRRFRRGVETVTALDAVDVRVSAGELTVAAGPSGSGKTTLLSVIAGLERSDSGVVETLDGVSLAGAGWDRVAFVPQSLALLEELTIAENVDLPGRLMSGGSDRKSSDRKAPGRKAPGRPVEELLAALDIAHLADRFPRQVSGGEQQRAAVGRALRLSPGVLLTDEPTGHQDRARVDLVLEVLRQHAYAGHVVLMSSHDEAVITAADRVLTLADGRLISDQRPHTIANPA